MSTPTQRLVAGHERLWGAGAVVSELYGAIRDTAHGADPPGSVVVAIPPSSSAATQNVAVGQESAPNTSPLGVVSTRTGADQLSLAAEATRAGRQQAGTSAIRTAATLLERLVAGARRCIGAFCRTLRPNAALEFC
jgi:hypothetical protein